MQQQYNIFVFIFLSFQQEGIIWGAAQQLQLLGSDSKLVRLSIYNFQDQSSLNHSTNKIQDLLKVDINR